MAVSRDFELAQARHRIDVLEVERACGNDALNALLLRTMRLETELAATAAERGQLERRFADYLRAQISALTAIDASLAARKGAGLPRRALKRALASVGLLDVARSLLRRR